MAGKSLVILLHVDGSDGKGRKAITLAQAQISKLQERLRQSKLIANSVAYQQVTLRGNPVADVIVKFAREKNIDLIVMGTNGRTGLSRVFVGSVAQTVMKDAPCPVVTIKLPLDRSPTKRKSSRARQPGRIPPGRDFKA
jgi:nucleotide-binding universal stress UspA family protein